MIIRFALIALALGTDRTGALRELIEGPAALSIHGVFPGECLPAANGDIDISGSMSRA